VSAAVCACVCACVCMYVRVCCRCQFHGTATELAAHVEHCQYEAMKHYIQQTEGRFNELVQTLKQKDQEINFLRVMLGQLSTKVESLEKTVEGARFRCITAHLSQLISLLTCVSWLVICLFTCVSCSSSLCSPVYHGLSSLPLPLYHGSSSLCSPVYPGSSSFTCVIMARHLSAYLCILLVICLISCVSCSSSFSLPVYDARHLSLFTCVSCQHEVIVGF